MWTSSDLQRSGRAGPKVGCWCGVASLPPLGLLSLRRMGGCDRDTPKWPRRVCVGVMEHLERVLALAYRKLERLTGLRVGDRHGHVAVVRTPQQPDLDPVARAAVE